MSAQDEKPSLVDPRWGWIRIRLGTRARLQKLMRFRESYDDKIKELLDHAEAL